MTAAAPIDPSTPSQSAPLPRRVLLLQEFQKPGDFDLSFADGLKQHGCEVVTGMRTEPWTADVDAVLGYGPFSLQNGNMLPMGRHILSMPPTKRPALMWVLTEGVPDARIPHALVDPLARLRLSADHILEGALKGLPNGLRKRLLAGHRLRVLGQLQWLSRHGVLTCLGVTSESRSHYLQRHGLQSIVTPLGYHELYGIDLGLTRDVDAVFLGNLDSPRRQRILPGLFAALESRGVKVSVQAALYGRQRTEYLNRCRVMINVLRAEQDFVGQRFTLAAANKVLVVSEPLNDSAPFIAGKHLIVAPLEQMADTVCEVLHDEERRSRLADQAHDFVTRELTVGNMMGALLNEAARVRQTA